MSESDSDSGYGSAEEDLDYEPVQIGLPPIHEVNENSEENSWYNTIKDCCWSVILYLCLFMNIFLIEFTDFIARQTLH